jgi:methanogenic corrinoid protein MtbC1
MSDMTSDDTPTFNLKAVVQETGLKPDTLRAWERRYGVPSPDRTQGGHRLYSQQDINTLKWLLARQDEGLSISRAVSMWQSLRDEGEDPLQVVPLGQTSGAPASYNLTDLGDTIVELRHSWVDACMDFDERKAELVLAQAFSYYSPEAVCFELLQKGLAEIGNGWYEGSVTVQQEHFASALAMRRLDSLLAATPPPTRDGRIVIGCPPGDNHTFSPLLLALLLRRRGWDVIYLGADVPTNRLHNTIERTQPDLVLFSAQLLETAATLLDVGLYLHGIQVPMGYGGYVFNVIPDLRQRIPGHFLGTDITNIPTVVEHLLSTRPPIPPFISASEEYQHALTYFRERAGLVEAAVWQALDNGTVPHTSVVEGNEYLSRNILSALKLGDLEYIGANLQWIEGMMVNYNMPREHLLRFLTAYRDAAVAQLGAPAGQPILDWLHRVVATAVAAIGSPASSQWSPAAHIAEPQHHQK